MTTGTRILACAAVALVTSCAHAVAQSGRSDLNALATALDSTRAALRIPGLSAAVVADGRVILARGFGLADVETNTIARPETVYPIGSITKTFTSTLMYGRVRPELRVNGTHAADAVAMFERILSLSAPLPRWMEAWTSYLVAEHIATSDRARARVLANRALATKVDTDGLQARVARLLESL